MFVYRRTLIHKSSEGLEYHRWGISVCGLWLKQLKCSTIHLSSVRYERGTRFMLTSWMCQTVSTRLVWYVPKHTTLTLKVRMKSEWKTRSEESVESAEQQETCVSLLYRVKWWPSENQWAAYSMPIRTPSQVGRPLQEKRVERGIEKLTAPWHVNVCGYYSYQSHCWGYLRAHPATPLRS